jgi:hypothetical protein
MPWNGSGSYTLPPAFSPEVNGTTIDAARYNGLTNDVQSGITAALAKNGENAPTANLPMGNNKHTSAAAASATGQYLVYGQTGAVLGDLTTTNPIIAPLGTVALPAYSFTADTDTGFWSPGANQVSLTLGGTDVSRWSSTQTLFPLGSASSPSHSFIGDSNTGMYAATADILSLATAGSERIRLDSFGRLGGFALHNNAQLPSGTAVQYTGMSGTYTPTLTNVAGMISLASASCQWIRSANVVTVSGTFTAAFNTTAGNTVSFRMSLPIPSDFTVASNAGGTASAFTNIVLVDRAWAISADATNNEATFTNRSTGVGSSFDCSFHFTYLVL